jgi:hypothetical protein
MRPRIDDEHVLRRGYEGAVGLRPDDPALPAMRFETVFLSVRWIVETLARSTSPDASGLGELLVRLRAGPRVFESVVLRPPPRCSNLVGRGGRAEEVANGPLAEVGWRNLP